MIFLANLKIWRSEPFLLIFYQLFYTNWKSKRATSICRHKTVTSVIQRAKFPAWLDGKRSPTTLTLTFLVHCQSVIHLAVMASVNCQMSVHVKLDGKIFQVMTFTQNSLSWHNLSFFLKGGCGLWNLHKDARLSTWQLCRGRWESTTSNMQMWGRLERSPLWYS